MKSQSLVLITSFLTLLLSTGLVACSTTNTETTNSIKEVQTGIVQAINKRTIQPVKYRPNGNVGVSVGSGGHAGVYGSVDVATIGRLLKGPAKPRVVYEIIIKRDNGELIAITQPATIAFQRGDKVKILQRGGEARVIH